MSLIKELLNLEPEETQQTEQNLGVVDDVLQSAETVQEAKRVKPADIPQDIPYVDDELHHSKELKSLAKRHPEAIQAMMNWN